MNSASTLPDVFRDTFDHASVGLAHVSLDGRFVRVNDYLCRLLGRPRDEVLAVSFQEITHPEDLENDLQLLHELLAGARASYSMEKRYIRPDGEVVWAELNVSLMRDAAGQPLQFISVVLDIAARRQAQDQLQLVMGEMDHRVKNLLAVVHAIVRSSARNSPSAPALEAAIIGRLHGIGASHDLLVGKSVGRGDLAELVDRQMAMFTDQATGRVESAGPPVELTQRAVQAFGMVLHELATNACKYGSLSNESGRVCIAWSIGQSAAGETLHFRWSEHGGPPVTPPTRRGFGSSAVLRMLSGAIGGKAHYTFDPDGARFEAEVPLAGLRG